MADANTDPATKPIWHNPKWLTAIVAVISAFLTIPNVVSDWLTGQQEVELAKTEVAKQVQDIELQIITNTLAQQGQERVFILRYLARTHNDEDVQAWAAQEVERLDNLTALQETARANAERIAFLEAEAAKNSSVTAESRAEIERLRAQLSQTEREIASGLADAGIGETQTPRQPVLREIRRIIIEPVHPTSSIQSLRRYHTATIGFDDVGGHFLVNAAGVIETGRDLNDNPAILRDLNGGTIGIYVNCPAWPNHNPCNFTVPQVAALQQLIFGLMDRFDLEQEAVHDKAVLAASQGRTLGRPSNVISVVFGDSE